MAFFTYIKAHLTKDNNHNETTNNNLNYKVDFKPYNILH